MFSLILMKKECIGDNQLDVQQKLDQIYHLVESMITAQNLVIDCKWSDWSEWSGCKCNLQKQQRNRFMKHQAVNGGDNCTGLPVMNKDCVKDCIKDPNSEQAKELFDLVRKGNLENINHHLEDVDVDLYEDENNATALMVAVDNGLRDVVNVLLENGANIDKPGPNGMTAIFFAVIKENDDVIKLLLNKNASTTLKDNEGNSLCDYSEKVIDNIVCS